jgi:hypothetical protein
MHRLEQITKRNDRTHIRFDFDSVTQLLDEFESRLPLIEERFGDDNNPVNPRLESSWGGGKNSRDTVAVGRTGWPEGFRKAKETIERMGLLLTKSNNFYTGIESVRGVSGGMVDMGLYIAGEPECMFDFAETDTQQRVVGIGVEMFALADISPDQYIRRGVALMALVDFLESRGVRVEILAQEASAADVSIEINVVLKRASEPLDRDKMAFTLAHPGFMRKILFGLHDSLEDPTLARQIGFPEGHGRDMRNSPGFPSPVDLVVKGKSAYWSMFTSEKSITSWVLASASKFVSLDGEAAQFLIDNPIAV